MEPTVFKKFADEFYYLVNNKSSNIKILNEYLIDLKKANGSYKRLNIILHIIYHLNYQNCLNDYQSENNCLKYGKIFETLLEQLPKKEREIIIKYSNIENYIEKNNRIRNEIALLENSIGVRIISELFIDMNLTYEENLKNLTRWLN